MSSGGGTGSALVEIQGQCPSEGEGQGPGTMP